MSVGKRKNKKIEINITVFVVFSLIFLLCLSLVGLNLFNKARNQREAIDVLNKSLTAVNETKSCVFNIETKQEIVIPKLYYINVDYYVSGKTVNHPTGAEVEGIIDILGAKSTIKSYASENVIYVLTPDNGWTKQEIDDTQDQFNLYSDPLSYNILLQEVNKNHLKIEVLENYFLLIYNNKSDKFLEIIRDNLYNHIFDDFIDGFNAENDYNVIITNFDYFSLIDKSTYLPYNDNITLKMIITLPEETINIDQRITIHYKEFNTIEAIEIPKEIVDKAVIKDDLI